MCARFRRQRQISRLSLYAVKVGGGTGATAYPIQILELVLWLGQSLAPLGPGQCICSMVQKGFSSGVAEVGAGETQRWFQFVIVLSYVTFNFPSKCQSHQPQANTRGRSSSLELDFFISSHPLFCITRRASASLIEPWPTQSPQCSFC